MGRDEPWFEPLNLRERGLQRLGRAVVGRRYRHNAEPGALPQVLVRDLRRAGLIATLLLAAFFSFGHVWTFVREVFGEPIFLLLLYLPWLAVGLLLLFFWAYEAFALWSSPWWTAWIALGYFLAALLIDAVFRGAAFCKFLCPIGQFHFIHSRLSEMMRRISSSASLLFAIAATSPSVMRGFMST